MAAGPARISLVTSRRAAIAAGVAAALGLGHAATSAAWSMGSTLLLDTVGGEIERRGRERPGSVVVALVAIAVLKAVVAVAAPIVVLGPGRLPAWTWGRVPRGLSWTAAVVLVAYGGLLTAVGLLVQADVIHATVGADQRALAWHAFFWDPWFALWGLAFLAALRWSRTTGPLRSN